MNRNLWLLAVLLLSSFNLAEAQQAKKAFRIGYLGSSGSGPPPHSGKAYGISATSRVGMSLLSFEREEANPHGPNSQMSLSG